MLRLALPAPIRDDFLVGQARIALHSCAEITDVQDLGGSAAYFASGDVRLNLHGKFFASSSAASQSSFSV